ADVLEREKIAKEIEKTSDSIRKKYRALKTGRIEEGIALDRHFIPLIEPLRLFVDSPGKRATKRTSDAASAPKREKKEEKEQEEEEDASEIFERSTILHEFNDRCKRRKVERHYEPAWASWVKSTSRLSCGEERYIYQRIYQARESGNVIVPLRLTKKKKEKHVNLLYLQDSRRNDENVIGHFTWIKNLSRLIGSQFSKSTKKKYLCDRMTCYFTDVYIILPNENDKWLSFRGHNKRERLLFVVYDLECILAKKITDENISKFTYQHHKVFSVGCYVRCVYDEIMSIYKSYRGEDCVSWFVKELYDLAHRAKTIFDKNMAMAEFTLNVEWEKF
ncbi:hypothetical protein ALC57_11066, partial [Trachymyrmex cornetzi]